MSADQAARIADVLLLEAHVGRMTFNFQTSRKYAWLEPTDVVHKVVRLAIAYDSLKKQKRVD